MTSYDPLWAEGVENRNSEGEWVVAFGVGSGTLIKVGQTYYLYYLDSSRGPAGETKWRWARKVSASVTSFGSPEASGNLLKDEYGQVLINETGVQSGLSVAYDEYVGRFVLYRNNDPRTRAYWHKSTDGTGLSFWTSAGPNMSGELPTGGMAMNTYSGVYSAGKGVVSSQYGWYVYVNQTVAACNPAFDNSCGNTFISAILFIQ
jgi:hypothetical protein